MKLHALLLFAVNQIPVTIGIQNISALRLQLTAQCQ